jgi:adenosylmethionine-8-amino-7-oxononanoate aminotransferase
VSSEERARIVELDKRYVWHPYTPMEAYLKNGRPLVIERAEGSRLFDVDGRSYIDGNASWWTSLLGHGHPRLVRALTEQASRLCHTALGGMTHAPAARFGEALARVAPRGLEHVFYSDNGSTAVESAIKLCTQFWVQNGRPQKTHFLSLEDAFHGETLGVTALGGVDAFRRPFSALTMPVTHLPSPADGVERALEALERELVARADTIAALVVEPLVQGAGGMRMYGPEYLREARRLTEQHDVLFVVDEVFTGYGRTGTFWACDRAGISPDVLCSAKGLSGGLLPFAATLTSERVFRGFLGASDRAFYYGHTYCGNPLGAAVALEVLAIYEDEGILALAQKSAEKIARAFDALGQLPSVSKSRSLGMVGALELRSGSGYLAHAGWAVYERALELGAYVRPLGNVVYVCPALNISEADLTELLAIVDTAVRAVAV